MVGDRQTIANRLDVFPQGAGQLGFGQTFDGVEPPQQIARCAPGIDHMLDIDAAQLLGGGAGELALADPRLPAHQQRPPGRHRGVDRVDAGLVEHMHLFGQAGRRGQGDGMF